MKVGGKMCPFCNQNCQLSCPGLYISIFLVEFSGNIGRNFFWREFEIFLAIFPEIETGMQFFVSLLLFESLIWTFKVGFFGSPTPFDI